MDAYAQQIEEELLSYENYLNCLDDDMLEQEYADCFSSYNSIDYKRHTRTYIIEDLLENKHIRLLTAITIKNTITPITFIEDTNEKSS